MVNRQLNAEVLELLRRIIRPRGDWYEIQSICGLLDELLADLEALSPDRFPKAAIGGAVHLLKNADAIDEILVLTEDARGISGLKTQYPQHAGLLASSEKETLSETRKKLIVWLVVCTDHWVTRIESRDDNESKKDEEQHKLDARLNEAWRAIRRLSDEAMIHLDGNFDSVEALTDRLDELIQGFDSRTSDESSHRGFIGLERYFAYYAEQRKSRAISCRELKQRESPKIYATYVEFQSDPDTEVDDPAIKMVRNERELTEQRTTEHYLAGNSIDELNDGPTFWQSDKPVLPQFGDSVQSAVIRSKSQQAQRRRAAQKLPGRWETLTENEISRWLNEVRDRLLGEPHLAIAMLLLLLSGRPLTSVIGTRFVNTTTQLPGKLRPSDVFIDVSQQAIVSGVMRPEERRKRSKEWTPVLREHDGLLGLPIPWLFWHWITTVTNPLLDNCKKRSVSIFPANTHEKISIGIHDVLVKLRKGRSTRITQLRVESHLQSAVLQKGGDRVEAILIAGQKISSSSSAGLYYHSVEKGALERLYAEVTAEWADEFPPEPGAKFQAQASMFSDTVGSDLVLISESHRSLVSDLARQLEADRKSLMSPDGLVRFHNSFMNYALLFLMYGTGYRSVRDPISRESDIDFDNKTLVIADKTSDGFGHSKIVPLAGELLNQLIYVKAHLDWLSSQLQWYGLLEKEQAPFLFYLSLDLEPIQITPKTMTEQFKWAYPMPLNLNRHWLRTELKNQGVSGAFVDHFMGHWDGGGEPWGKYSCVDPREFCEVVRAALDQLLRAQKFISIRGAV
ncbi:hypothetical protein ABA45_02215 [Marinobacter psychrophilus]|uniref:Uncharacterized protein n=1 Tax=Marinobacter psychrophilus TaxID=330734 RepID=A0A0H4I178_9GAMM|nr:hypothetical protein ABA45_02215 [Marinobacter psychrophilus]